jgi:hypothetical protein
VLDDVTEALEAIGRRGAFATRSTAEAGDLALEVKGVGAVRFPVPAAQARKLCGVARPARFGKREETLLDRDVRDTWEIARSRVKIDKRRWSQTLAPQLERIQRELGLPEGGKLEATLDKMLVYAPGQFFAAHQDTERAAEMVGTLTVVLPAAHKGGATVIDHHGEKVTYLAPRRADKLTFIAFYGDCHHEVRPITDGYRLVLVYQLLFEAPAARASAAPGLLEPLIEAVDSHLTTPLPAHPRYGRESPPPDKLVYLLDHQYTQQSLGWERLKGPDLARAAVLREAAERLDCEIFLTLADVHETWSCESSYWGYRGRRDDRDVERDPEPHELIELCSEDIELRHWIDGAGKPLKNASDSVSPDELCFTRASIECEPFRSEHEGWMGNYGDTVDRWYHRAAVVLWPRSRAFAIRAKLSPRWALDRLRRSLKTAARAEARTRAASLLPFWSRIVGIGEDKAFVTRALQVAVALEDPTLAAGLVAPFGPTQLGKSAVPHIAALLEAHGLEWCREIFAQWLQRQRFRDAAGVGGWFELMPVLCRALVDGGGEPGRALARWLLEQHWSNLARECRESLEDSANPHALARLTAASHLLFRLLESCVAAGEVEIHDEIVGFLTAPNTGFPVSSLVTALQAIGSDGRRPPLEALRLERLHRHCVGELTAVLAAPPRAADDWSIEPPARCRCELCQKLAAFLADREQVRFEWPLSTEKRSHVHQQIDAYELPVVHSTRRKGRPYTLLLAKTKALFAKEEQRREAHERHLAWLVQHQPGVVVPAR